MMNIEERKVVAEPTKALDIPLDDNNPKRYTRVRVDMGKKMKQDLV